MMETSHIIKAVVMDVDGVLTDGHIYLSAEGPGLKRLSFRDVMGVSLGRKAGLRFALISGEGGPLLERIASQFGIEEVFPDCKDKAQALQTFASRNGLALSELCFMGDDVNDLPAMAIVGHSACPADAHPSVLGEALWVMKAKGGQGAVRELLDLLSAKPKVRGEAL